MMTVSHPIHVMHVMDKLSVSGSGIHGVGRAVEWWVSRFNQNEFRFSVCSLRAPESAGVVFKEQGIPVFFMDKGKFDPLTVLSLLKLVKQERPQILHLHGYGATNFGRLVTLLTGLPNIVHEHTVIDPQPLYQTLADRLLSTLTTRAIAVSQPVQEFMVAHRSINPAKLDTFFIGLPLSEFQTPEAAAIDQLRHEFGIRPDDNVVCTVGRLDTQKGQRYLLEAAVLVLKTLPNTRFLIVGEGPDRDMLQQFAQVQGITDQMILTGLRTDVPALLALSDVVAIPSLWEGGPITLFEAMSLHKPVVGTPVGAMKEIIQEGETGYLVPSHDGTELAEKLIDLLTDPQLAKSMGTQGWKICQNYDISHSVQRLSEIYRSLVA